MTPRAFAAFAAMLVLPRLAAARELRPHDAPLLEDDARVPPQVPREYLTHEAAGIRFAYQPSTHERVRPLFGRVAAIREELTRQLGRRVLDNVEIRVAAALGEMARLSPGARHPTYSTAVAFSDAHLIVMSAEAPTSFDPPDLEAWLRHELAHLALDEAAGGNPLPRWLHEGFAVHTSGEDATLRAETLCRAALQHRLLALGDIDAQLPAAAPQASIAYAQAADFARFLSDGPNQDSFADLLARVRSGEPFEGALSAAYGGVEVGGVELRWRKEMARRYSFLPVFAGAMLLWIVVALAVVARRFRRKQANVAPRAARREERRPPRRRGGAREDRLPTVPDHELPKVEHDGDWHTLH